MTFKLKMQLLKHEVIIQTSWVSIVFLYNHYLPLYLEIITSSKGLWFPLTKLKMLETLLQKRFLCPCILSLVDSWTYHLHHLLLKVVVYVIQIIGVVSSCWVYTCTIVNRRDVSWSFINQKYHITPFVFLSFFSFNFVLFGVFFSYFSFLFCFSFVFCICFGFASCYCILSLLLFFLSSFFTKLNRNITFIL